jgi:hypothetical protein
MSTEKNGHNLAKGMPGQFPEGDEYKSKVAAGVCHSTRLKISRIHLFEEAKAVK